MESIPQREVRGRPIARWAICVSVDAGGPGAERQAALLNPSPLHLELTADSVTGTYQDLSSWTASKTGLGLQSASAIAAWTMLSIFPLPLFT